MNLEHFLKTRIATSPNFSLESVVFAVVGKEATVLRTRFDRNFYEVKPCSLNQFFIMSGILGASGHYAEVGLGTAIIGNLEKHPKVEGAEATVSSSIEQFKQFLAAEFNKNC